VSESGLSDPETVKQLKALGYNGFLMGEAFMSQPDPGLALNAFIAQL
jgi:indole-3-glycerol phosphate synthase